MNSNNTENKLYPIYYFLKAYPKRSLFTVFALLFSGLAEAVSFAAMIPLLGMALLQNGEDKELGFLESGITKAFEMVGLEANIG